MTKRTVLLLLPLLALACGAGGHDPRTVDAGAAAVGGPGVAADGRLLSDPAPATDGQLRVLVYHDMEGLSGQDDWRTFDFGHPSHYEPGRRLLTADVNAVIFASGDDKLKANLDTMPWLEFVEVKQATSASTECPASSMRTPGFASRLWISRRPTTASSR